MLQTVAIRTPKYLCIKDNSLIIREKGSSVVLGKIALSDIWVIIIDNPQVTMTSALISGINDAGIGVLYCGSDHMPNGLALPLGAHSRHAEIVEHQLAISKPLRNQIWKRLVTKKIENQAKALALCFGDSAEVKKIRGYAQEVQSNDKTNRESIAASEYFKALLPYGTRWNGPMTAPLNYGYAILRSGIAQCAVSHGWLVSRGIHHHSAENAFNLVDDLIEPFRPIVDLKVVSDNILEPLSTTATGSSADLSVPIRIAGNGSRQSDGRRTTRREASTIWPTRQTAGARSSRIQSPFSIWKRKPSSKGSSPMISTSPTCLSSIASRIRHAIGTPANSNSRSMAN